MNLLVLAGIAQEFKTFWESREADFAIKYLTDFELFGQKLSITTTHVCTFIITVLLIVFALLANKCIKHAKEIPGYFQNFIELIVDMLDNMVKNTMGENSKRFVNYISSIFIFILISNISGLFGLRPPTADYGVTLPLGLITFALIHYNGVKKNKAGHFKAMFKPILLSPINIIGEIAVPISLSLRLFGNVLSGTVLMGLLYGLIPVLMRIGIPAVLHIYFDLFSGAIQTYVFCMLTMVYVNDKIAD